MRRVVAFDPEAVLAGVLLALAATVAALVRGAGMRDPGWVDALPFLGVVVGFAGGLFLADRRSPHEIPAAILGAWAVGLIGTLAATLSVVPLVEALSGIDAPFSPSAFVRPGLAGLLLGAPVVPLAAAWQLHEKRSRPAAPERAPRRAMLAGVAVVLVVELAVVGAYRLIALLPLLAPALVSPLFLAPRPPRATWTELGSMACLVAALPALALASLPPDDPLRLPLPVGATLGLALALGSRALAPRPGGGG